MDDKELDIKPVQRSVLLVYEHVTLAVTWIDIVRYELREVVVAELTMFAEKRLFEMFLF